MLFTAASTVWTNSNNGGWSQSYGNFTTQDVYATVLSDNTLRVFTNNGNQDIAEWYYDQNGNGGQNTQYFRGQTMNGGSDICATSQTTSRGLVDVVSSDLSRVPKLPYTNNRSFPSTCSTGTWKATSPLTSSVDTHGVSRARFRHPKAVSIRLT